jgi:hypothetical protein
LPEEYELCHRAQTALPVFSIEGLIRASLVPQGLYSMTKIHGESQDAIRAESVLAFNWRKLIALGVSQEDARSIATTLIIKQLIVTYWRRLVGSGVPIDNARRIARAIAKYDVLDTLPTQQQQQLIRHYCPILCRTGLWRAQLLLHSRP